MGRHHTGVHPRRRGVRDPRPARSAAGAIGLPRTVAGVLPERRLAGCSCNRLCAARAAVAAARRYSAAGVHTVIAAPPTAFAREHATALPPVTRRASDETERLLRR